MKIFREWQPLGERGLFLLVLFGMASISSWFMIGIRRTKIRTGDITRGILLGIPNFFASYFLIAALQDLPGIVVYPLVNVSIILFTAIGGVLIWKERINRVGWVSVGLAIISIVLLSN